MKFNIKKICIVIFSILFGIYSLFLILPLVASPIVNSYSDEISKMIKDSTGYETKMEGFGAVTSFDLSAGVKAKRFSLYVPGEENAFFQVENFRIRLSLLPLFLRKIQIHDVSMDTLAVALTVKENGNFSFFDYLKQHEKKDDENVKESVDLPLGFELSNTLPNIRIDDYKVEFVELKTGKSYFLEGSDLYIHDFVLDKSVKVSTTGKIVFDGSEISNYNIKIYNRIMPELKLHDLIFSQSVSIEQEDAKNVQENMPFNIIEIFDSVKKNAFHANLFVDVKTSGTFKNPVQRGHFRVDNLSVAVGGKQLPESYVDLIFKGHKSSIDSLLHTAGDLSEQTKISGEVINGKKPSVNLILNSNAKIDNIIRLIDSVAQSFGNNDFKTISATGSVDANFNIKSDMKNLLSSGYLKINPSSLYYGLYNIGVDNIAADVDMKDNNVDIKDLECSVLGHKLKLTGKIMSDTYTDLKLVGENLAIKGLLAAAGQKALLKDNNFYSGLLSVNAVVTGKFNELNPDVSLDIKDVNILNKPSNLKVLLSKALVKLTFFDKNASGNIDINSLALKMPQASVSVPSAKILADTNNIDIQNSYLLVNKSRVDVKGIVKDYLSKQPDIDISATGNLAASDVIAFLPKEVHSMFPYSGSLPLNLTLTGDAKTQNIVLDLVANPTNYIKFADIDLLKNKVTKIHSEMKYFNDILSFYNSSISSSDHSIATLSGDISKLTSDPKLNLNINVPHKVSFPIWGINNSNISAYGDIAITGKLSDPYAKGTVNIPDISIKDMDFALSDIIARLNGKFINGSASAAKFKYGNIIATKLSSDLSLINYSDIYFKNLTGDAFSGKIYGKLSYNIPKTAIGFIIEGKSLNSTDAVYGAIGLKNALTGILNFNANLKMHGVTDKEIINSMTGTVDFDVTDGRFIGIGKLENLVAAQNIESISLLKSAISALSTLSAIQETNKFKSITGQLTMKNGTATIPKIEVLGPLMSYYVKGDYYVLPNSAYLVILGRLDSKVVSYLGVVGEFSAEKLLSYIPKFGPATAQVLSQITSDPANENTSLIPPLTTGSTSYRDFKVIYNGSIEKSTSVRNFKWLSKCDTTEMNLKKDIQDAAQAVKTNIDNQINATKTSVENMKTNVTNIINAQKQAVEDQKNSLEQTKTDIQNAAQNAGTSAVNLGKLFLNAASNANNKMEIKSPEQTQTQTSEQTQSQSQTQSEANDSQGAD